MKILNKVKNIIKNTSIKINKEILPEIKTSYKEEIKPKIKEITKTSLLITGTLMKNLSEQLYQTAKNIQTENIEISKKKFEWEFSAAGVTFNGRQEIIKSLLPSMKAQLEYSPTIRYPERIKILIDEFHIGYVPAKIAKKIYKIIEHIEVLSWKVTHKEGTKNYGVRLCIKTPYIIQ